MAEKTELPESSRILEQISASKVLALIIVLSAAVALFCFDFSGGLAE